MTMITPSYLGETIEYSSLHACRSTLEDPTVYLGVADVLGVDGAVCDHLVVMRRMPEERRLETLVTAGEHVDAELRAVARAVAVFHARCATSEAIAAAGTAPALTATWEANVAGLQPFVGTILDGDLEHRVEARAERFLAGRAPLLAQRMAEGRIRDGHGDLLAADIFCLPDGPRILDCIEFDDRLRHADVLADVAFLAMDLERLGRADLARRFLDHYREFSGDTFPATLAHHYIAYRAHVRAKVACLRHEQGDAAAAAQAGQLLRMAFVHAEEARVILTLVGGLPGTGKSTLAAAVGDALGWTVLRSDEVRRDVAGLPHTAAPVAEYAEGLHTPAMTERTYAELLRRAEQLLGAGEPVVVDATWTDRRWRARAEALARSTASDLVELECRAPRELAESRITARLRAGADISDATPAIARRMAGDADPWFSAVQVDTTHGPAEALAHALRAIGETGAGSTGSVPGRLPLT